MTDIGRSLGWRREGSFLGFARSLRRSNDDGRRLLERCRFRFAAVVNLFLGTLLLRWMIKSGTWTYLPMCQATTTSHEWEKVMTLYASRIESMDNGQ